uniref:Uncharacterized protein n=1 Tax=Lygus hesperus TaxID=30085 RepID=A0A0K8S2Y6_LYGHE
MHMRCITMSHIFHRKTGCLDFSGTTSNDSQHLSGSLPNFHSYLTGPLKNSYKLHELKCNGGKMQFCGYKQRIERTCPKVSLNGRRTVIGAVKLCGIRYTLSSCQLTGRVNQTVVLKSFGDIHGVTDGVEIKFVIVSVGLRYSVASTNLDC